MTGKKKEIVPREVLSTDNGTRDGNVSIQYREISRPTTSCRDRLTALV